MQNRYVSDIGVGILRGLSPEHRLGIAWWLHPDENHNRDGRHIGYLRQPDRWRQFDPALFDTLAMIVASGLRDVQALERANLLSDAVFARELTPISRLANQRLNARREWIGRMLDRLADADLDPDNALNLPAQLRLSEVREKRREKRLAQQHTRQVGGHHAEIAYWVHRLRAADFSTVDALRARPYSPRVYFLLNALPDLWQRAEKIGSQWCGKITWHPGDPRWMERDIVDAGMTPAHHGLP